MAKNKTSEAIAAKTYLNNLEKEITPIIEKAINPADGSCDTKLFETPSSFGFNGDTYLYNTRASFCQGDTILDTYLSKDDDYRCAITISNRQTPRWTVTVGLPHLLRPYLRPVAGLLSEANCWRWKSYDTSKEKQRKKINKKIAKLNKESISVTIDEDSQEVFFLDKHSIKSLIDWKNEWSDAPKNDTLR